MRTCIAAAAVVALSGAAHGFVVNTVSVRPNTMISPSVGSFFLDATWLNGDNMLVTGSADDWFANQPTIESNTFLALDRQGGASGYSLLAATKGGDNVLIPEWNAATGNSIGVTTPGVDYGILFDGSGIMGGSGGIAWDAGPGGGFAAPSADSLVNGRTIDSIFIGMISLSDPSADLVGDDLYAKIDGADILLPLDGSPGTGGYALEFERNRLYSGQVEMFIVVPTPGALGLLGVAGLAATRRRR
jgi:hypothetical protein